jgi:hypothetical protein
MVLLADHFAEPRVGGDGARDRSYRIPLHVHVCVTGDGSVLLDLKRDRYFGLGREDTELLAAVVKDWPRPSWAHNSYEGWNEECAERVCRSMLEDKLLVKTGTLALGRCSEVRSSHGADGACGTGHAEIRINMKAPFVSVGDELEIGAEVRPWHVARFTAAYVWALYSLRRRPLVATVAAVRARKSRRLEACVQWDLLRVAGLIDIFRRLRPYVFSAEGHCLLHALTLVRFLGSHDVYPEWVIGVSTQPWAAHSWVQWGNYLLDTNPEKVCRYTPILVV